MRQPEGFVAEGEEHLVCKLKQSLYGLKQSPRCWNARFLQSNSDPCIYIAAVDEVAVIDVYVVACKSDTQLKEIKQALCKKFDVKDLGELHHFLGMKIAQDEDVWIGQPAYIDKVIEKYGMQH